MSSCQVHTGNGTLAPRAGTECSIQNCIYWKKILSLHTLLINPLHPFACLPDAGLGFSSISHDSASMLLVPLERTLILLAVGEGKHTAALLLAINKVSRIDFAIGIPHLSAAVHFASNPLTVVSLTAAPSHAAS